MMLKAILFLIGVFAIVVLFFLQNAFSKPVYNKMSNVWQDDEEGRQISHFMICTMVVIGFLLGLLVS